VSIGEDIAKAHQSVSTIAENTNALLRDNNDA
jgi:hypothetical protein